MLKKTLLLLCFGLILFISPAQAQKPHSDLLNEIGVDAGPVSIFGGFIVGTVDFFNALGSSMSHQTYSSRYFGVYNLHYYRQVKPWCQVGAKFTVEGSRITRYTDSLQTAIHSISDDLLFTFMPSVRFTYLNRPWVRLYSGVDVGLGYLFSNIQGFSKDDSKGNKFLPAMNITAFGVNVGKGFYGLFELNAGFDSIVKVGIGARF